MYSFFLSCSIFAGSQQVSLWPGHERVQLLPSHCQTQVSFSHEFVAYLATTQCNSGSFVLGIMLKAFSSLSQFVSHFYVSLVPYILLFIFLLALVGWGPCCPGICLLCSLPQAEDSDPGVSACQRFSGKAVGKFWQCTVCGITSVGLWRD